MNPSTMDSQLVTLLCDGLASPARVSSSMARYTVTWDGIRSDFSRFIANPSLWHKDLSQDVCSRASWYIPGFNNQSSMYMCNFTWWRWAYGSTGWSILVNNLGLVDNPNGSTVNSQVPTLWLQGIFPFRRTARRNGLCPYYPYFCPRAEDFVWVSY